MYSHLLQKYNYFFILIVVATIINNIPNSVFAQENAQYATCANVFNCSNKQNLPYPFWGPGRPSFCGHPAFELTCSGAAPEITINSTAYRMLDFDNSSHSLSVARADYWDTNCPRNLRNSTSDPSPIFSYAADTQSLTLFYNCSVSPSAPVLPPTRFNCSADIGVNNFFGTDEMIKGLGASTLLSSQIQSCAESVVVRISNSEATAVTSSLANPTQLVNLTAVLDSGFGINWSANDSRCEECQNSGGLCGSTNSTTSVEFSCYCKEGTFSLRCGSNSDTIPGSGSGKNQTPKAVGLSIAGACILGMFIGGLTYYLIQRRKRRAALAKSRDLSTPPSSKGIIVPSTNFSQSTPSASSYNTFSKSDIEKGSTYFGVQVFSYAELEEATDNFDSSRELGEGGFGTVYYGKLRDGRVVAVKRLYENNFKRVEQFMNEVEILTRLEHQSLVKLYGCTSRRSRELLLVYEFIPNGTVADHLHGKQSNSSMLSWPVRLSIAIETADALAYLHRSEIIHRDVKTNNILLDNEFRVKVADFGLSKLFPNDVTHVSTAPQGTPGYVDPEYYQCYQLTTKSDVYSFGVVLIELISSLQAVDTNRHRHDINLANMAINKIQNHLVNELVDPSLGFDKDENVKRMATDVAELAFRCLQQERDMRPSMEEVLAALRAIQNEKFARQKPEVVDIRSDDIGLLKNLPPPLSPDSVVTDKWISSSTTPSSY